MPLLLNINSPVCSRGETKSLLALGKIALCTYCKTHAHTRTYTHAHMHARTHACEHTRTYTLLLKMQM